jgi:thioredoxin 1
MIKIKKYSATWCMPCKQLYPIFTQLKNEYPNIVFEDIDVNNQKERIINEGITSVPTIIFEKNNQEIKRIIGIKSKQEYINIIKSLI